MTTLHTLRRTYALSFSELAVLTAVPVRRLAEFEYHGHPLSAGEIQSLASFFGVAEHTLEGGFVARHVAQPTLTQSQAHALAALAAVAVLAWSLRLGQPSSAVPANQPLLAAMGTGADQSLDTFNNISNQLSLITPTATATPTATLAPTFTATPTTTLAPTFTATPTATLAPTAEPTVIPTALPPQPTATPRPLRAARLRKRPTPVPQLAQAPQAAEAAQPSRQQAQRGLPALSLSDAGEPQRCPAVPDRGQVILTQGYGVGSHAPAELWGGLDLAVAGGPTEGTLVVAANAGYVQVALNTWPGGNFISISSDSGWRTAYAHLATVLVESGQYVQAGTPIGTIGSTGNVTGPHLHYETWFNGVNVDPSPYLFCR